MSPHGMATHSTASHSMADSGIALHGTASTGIAERSTASNGTAEHGTAERVMAGSSTASHSTAESGSTHSETGSTHNGKPADKPKQAKRMEHSTANIDAALHAPAHATEVVLNMARFKRVFVHTSRKTGSSV